MERVEAPTTATLEAIADAFNRHDVDAIMAFFAEDAVFEAPARRRPWGRRLVGKDQVREGFATRFAGVPDVHYGDASHWVSGERRRLGMDAHRERRPRARGFELRGLWIELDVPRRAGGGQDSYWRIVSA